MVQVEPRCDPHAGPAPACRVHPRAAASKVEVLLINHIDSVSSALPQVVGRFTPPRSASLHFHGVRPAEWSGSRLGAGRTYRRVAPLEEGPRGGNVCQSGGKRQEQARRPSSSSVPDQRSYRVSMRKGKTRFLVVPSDTGIEFSK